MSKFPSRYSPGKFVTAAQYITEYVCEKKAKREGKDLPTQFWALPEWAKFYKSQIFSANALLKKYDVDIVLAAVKNLKAKWMYSLRAPGFEGILLEEKRNAVLRGQASLAENKQIEAMPDVDVNAKPSVPFKQKTIANALEDL